MSTDIKFDVNALMAKLEALAVQHGPQAVELASEVVRVDAIGALILFLANLSIFLMNLKLCIKYYKIYNSRNPYNHREDYDKYLEHDNNQEKAQVMSSVFGGFAALSAVLTVFFLPSIWDFVALFNPQLALAHEIWVKML